MTAQRHVLVLLIGFWWFIVPAIGQPGIDASLAVQWPVNQWEKVPEYNWENTEGASHSLVFRSVCYQDSTTDVFAYYSNPDIVSGRAPSGRNFPAVVLVHGGSGRAFSQWVEQWAKAGYAAIAMDLTGRGADGQRMDNGGPPMTAETMFMQMDTGEFRNLWTYHSVASVIIAHSLLRSFPEVDEHAVGLTGVSWGGYLTALVAALDHRFMAAVPVYGCGYLDESDVFSGDLGKLTPAGRAKWLAAFDPSVYMGSTAIPILFINGNKDRFYNVVPHAKSVALVDPRNRYTCIKPDLPHNYEAAWALDEIRTFFNAVRQDFTPFFPRVTAIKIKPSGIEASLALRDDMLIHAAYFYYTTDTVSSNEHRAWSRMEAECRGSVAVASIPREAFAYGFFDFRLDGTQSFSSQLIVE